MRRSSRLKAGQFRFAPSTKVRKSYCLKFETAGRESNQPFFERFSKRSSKKGHRPEALAWDWRSPKQLSKCTAAEFMRPVKAEERGPPSRLSLKQRGTDQPPPFSLDIQREEKSCVGR